MFEPEEAGGSAVETALCDYLGGYFDIQADRKWIDKLNFNDNEKF